MVELPSVSSTLARAARPFFFYDLVGSTGFNPPTRSSGFTWLSGCCHACACTTCYHNKIRQEVFNMCNAANLGGVCVEKRGLIPGSRKKPADVYIGSWFLDEGYSACAIDIVTTDAEASLTPLA